MILPVHWQSENQQLQEIHQQDHEQTFFLRICQSCLMTEVQSHVSEMI